MTKEARVSNEMAQKFATEIATPYTDWEIGRAHV